MCVHVFLGTFQDFRKILQIIFHHPNPLHHTPHTTHHPLDHSTPRGLKGESPSVSPSSWHTMSDSTDTVQAQPPAASWGEMLGSYCEERAKAGPAIERSFKFTRKQGGVVKVKERLFNPITQKHIDKEREQATAEREDARYIKNVNTGMRKALTTASLVGYDIVNQEPKFGVKGVEKLGTEQSERGKKTHGVRPPESNVQYNIVTLERNHAEEPQRSRRGHRNNQRQYNVLQHKYVDNHDAIVGAKDASIRSQYKAHKLKQYDPIRATHNNPTEEAAYQAAVEVDADKKRAAFHTTTNATPVCVQRSEGHNYNILDGTVFSSDQVVQMDNKAQCGVPHRKKAREVVAQQIQACDTTIAKKREQSVAKVAHQRHVDRCRSGYDIITGSRPQPCLLPQLGKGAVEEKSSVWGLVTK